jgi:hypothetical protein
VPAVRTELHEVKSSIILQPGPAALTDGGGDSPVISEWVAAHGWRSCSSRHLGNGLPRLLAVTNRPVVRQARYQLLAVATPPIVARGAL